MTRGFATFEGLEASDLKLHAMKIFSAFVFSLFLCLTLAAQDQLEPDVSAFNQLIVSDGIDVILEQGDSPNLKLSYVGIDPDAIVVENKRNKLAIYLKDFQNGHLRVSETDQSLKVIAYVTYTSLTKLVVKGDNDVIGLSPINAGKFVLESFGENRISLREVKARKFNLNLYGENEVTIDSGEALTYRLKEFGNNKINTWRIKTDRVKVVPWVIVEGITRDPRTI